MLTRCSVKINVSPVGATPLRAGSSRVITLRLEDRDLLIGRKVGPDHVEIADPYVSKLHAEIVRVDTGWAIRDLGSTNGTRVNGTRLERGETCLLASGQEIQVGPHTLLTVGEVIPLTEARPDGLEGGRTPSGS